MNIGRSLFLITGAALTALALGATTATAQESEVEVVDEATHEPCDPCVVHLVGETSIRDSMGNLMSTCEDELEGELDADGMGDLGWNPQPHGGPGCNVGNCANGQQLWPIYAVGELGSGEEHARINMCFRHPVAGPFSCAGQELHVGEAGEHDYVLSLDNEACITSFGVIRITSEWEIESSGCTDHAAIEVEHHDD